MTLEEKIKYIPNKIRDFRYRVQTKELVSKLKELLDKINDKIPIFIISYNNAIYVENIVKQLNGKNIKPIIIDNNSTDINSIKILQKIVKEGRGYIIFSKRNFGHSVGFLNPIFEVMPEVFAYSDPDLQLNKKLPDNFLDILANLTKEFNVFKAGFALELLDEEMTNADILKYYGVPKIIKRRLDIKTWEKRYWRFPICHNHLELYSAPLDTTFAVYRKSNFVDNFFEAIRVAGDFSAIHLPWYPKRDLMNLEDKKKYIKSNKSSTWIRV